MTKLTENTSKQFIQFASATERVGITDNPDTALHYSYSRAMEKVESRLRDLPEFKSDERRCLFGAVVPDDMQVSVVKSDRQCIVTVSVRAYFSHIAC